MTRKPVDALYASILSSRTLSQIVMQCSRARIIFSRRSSAYIFAAVVGEEGSEADFRPFPRHRRSVSAAWKRSMHTFIAASMKSWVVRDEMYHLTLRKRPPGCASSWSVAWWVSISIDASIHARRE